MVVGFLLLHLYTRVLSRGTLCRNFLIKWSVGYGLTDKRSYGGSNTTGLSTQPSANAYLRSSRRYTVLRSKGT